MGATREQRLIKTLQPQVETRTPIATEMFLPNHSGDLSAGKVLRTPSTSFQPVNKKFVEENFLRLNCSNVPLTNNLHLKKQSGEVELITETIAASIVKLTLKNSQNTWELRNNASGNINFYDKTGTKTPVTIVKNAPNGSLWIDGNGDIGLGYNGSPGYNLLVYRATGAVTAAVWSGAAAIARFRMTNSQRTWTFENDGAGNFTIRDLNSGNYVFNMVAGSPQYAMTIWTDKTIFNDSGADQDFYVESDTNDKRIFVDAGTDNIGLGGNSFGSGSGIIFIANATTTPSTDPTGGGILYVSSGALMYKGSSGTITTIASA